MKCVYCGTSLGAINYCVGCGADVTLLKRIGRISNLLYNRGLDKATVRDLSGAIGCLTQSLKFNKENIDARNLLGLCYYETGEVVSALCEWVISKNMDPSQENPAQRYIDELQNNKNQLDVISQSIRKYNQSIEYCQQGQEDMAVMQLKKVVAQNPKLVKAQQLLALLYMKEEDYDKAGRVLKKALSIDNTNTTTLRYITEVEEETAKTKHRSRFRLPWGEEPAESDENPAGTLRYVSGNEVVIQPTTFRDSSAVATFINIGLGVLLGGAIVWFMAIPALRISLQDEANRKVTDANLQLASQTAQFQDLQAEIDGYQRQVDEADRERDSAMQRVENYDNLLGIATQYVQGEQTAAIESLTKVNVTDLEGNAKRLYDNLSSAVSTTLFDQYYTAGTTAYVSMDFATSAAQLQQAIDMEGSESKPNYENALYYLGFSYYNLNDSINANKYLTMVAEKFPARAMEVQPFITGSIAQQNAGTNLTTPSPAAGAAAGTAAAGQDPSMTGGGTDLYGQTTPDLTGGTDLYGQYTYQTGGTDTTGYLGYNPADVAWTDPYTGLNYDMYGNLLG